MGDRRYIFLFLCAYLANVDSKELIRADKDCDTPIKRSSTPQCQWHYITYFPHIFRTGITENVIFSAPGFPNAVDVNITVFDRKNLISNVRQNVPAGTQASIPLPIPHDSPGNVKVKVEGSGKTPSGDTWIFTNTSKNIRVEKLGLSILIQTDRPIYKPGQTIRSRVIVVDTDLKPYSGMLDRVIIENPSGSIMRLWKDVKLEDGFASFDLKTSVKPILGNWKIKVELKSYKKTLRVELKKYVLPKFQVYITPPSYISVMMEKITAEVCAKYSYGKPVVGQLDATICNRRYYGYSIPECLAVSKRIDGCTMITIDMLKLMPSKTEKGISPQIGMFGSYRRNLGYLTFEATVKEKATGIAKSNKAEQRVLRNEVELSIQSPSVFKPGFPVSAKISAKYPDGVPIKSVDVTLQASVGGSNEKLINEKNITIMNGVYKLELPTIPFSAGSISIKVTHIRKKLFKEEKDYERKHVAYKTLSPWYSPSHSYLNIQKPNNVVKIGDKVNIAVGYTSVDATEIEREITYSLMCGGNLVHSEMFKKTFVGAIQRKTEGSPKSSPPSRKITTKEVITTGAPATVAATGSFSFQNKSIHLYTVKTLVGYTWWNRPSATRPPLPPRFSTDKFTFSFDVTRKMLPSCRMIVYYIRHEEVIADETEFNVADEFENNVSMKFEKSEVKPGNQIKLTVRGAPNSRIAVAAVDKSIHFLAKGNDIKQKDLSNIRERLTIQRGWVSEYGRCPNWYGRRRRGIIWPGYGGTDFVDSEKAFANVGVVVLSSLRVDTRPCEARPVIMEYDSYAAKPPGSNKKTAPGSAKKAPRARTEFPETWLWTDEKLSADGVRVYDLKVPDTITTWYASGFAISKAAGLGVANAAELRAFQPFFISLNLPYSVIRDEDVTVPAAIFSYLENSCMTIRVTLDYSVDYKMIAGPNAKTCLCGGRTATVLFRIRPKKLGYIKIRVGAQTMSDNVCAAGRPFDKNVYAADLLERKLLVEPEGLKEEYTRSSFFCPNSSPANVFETSYKLKLPDNLVPGSNFTKVMVIGDIMGASLSNIDELLAMPYGCGEQNMLKFAPNIFIMNYLKNTNQVNEQIKQKALDYMRTGYQRELTYKHKDGSYSAFGERDGEGSTWLSAFVLKTYAQAQPWIDIDPKEIEETMTWLFKLQDKEGCFRKVGKLHNKAMQGGVKSTATLSAYVLISLLEAGARPGSKSSQKAGDCILNALPEFKDDSYSLALMAYAFAKLKFKKPYERCMKLLDRLAIKQDGMMHWEEPEKDKPVTRSYYYKARSTDIEQTAYVLMAKLAYSGKNAIDISLPIVRWLSKQRNGLGGWSSTQDTVLALQALAEFAEFTFSGDIDMDLKVNTADFKHAFKINSGNKLVLQTVENVPVPSSLSIRGTGKGCALVQTTVKYNVYEVKTKPTFSLTYTIASIDEPLNQIRSCRPQQLKVCARWLGEGESNMAIVDVQMISGFEVDEETLDSIRKSNPLFLKDIEIKEKNLVFYYNAIPKFEQCVEFRVDQTSNVRKTKPAPMTVYDYYDTDKSATLLYEFTDKHCTGV